MTKHLVPSLLDNLLGYYPGDPRERCRRKKTLVGKIFQQQPGFSQLLGLALCNITIE